MKQAENRPVLTAERPLLSDQERRERLARLAERLLEPNGLDREALERVEQLSNEQ
jgi:hypothetical protein